MLEALCRSSGTTLDSVHAEDGPPITQRTSGLSSRETPNNTSAAGGIGGCGIILDSGAAENGLRRLKTGFVLGFPGSFLEQDRVRA
jgi:hypothetical protein